MNRISSLSFPATYPPTKHNPFFISPNRRPTNFATHKKHLPPITSSIHSIVYFIICPQNSTTMSCFLKVKDCTNNCMRQKRIRTKPEVPQPLEEVHCPFCSKRFRNRSKLEKHISDFPCLHGARKCTLCSRTFADGQELLQHAISVHQNHRKDQIYECPLCKLQFRTQQLFLRHLKDCTSVSSETLTKCKLCKRRFVGPVQLLDHVIYKHCSFPRRFSCPFCVARYEDASTLKEHVAEQHGLYVPYTPSVLAP